MSAPTGGHRRIDRVLAPDFTSDLDSLSLEELRARRAEADQEEVDLSYLRRMLQGRSDLAQAELARRAEPKTGAAQSGAPESDAEVVSRITAALTEEGQDRSPAQGLGRHRAVEPSRVGETRRQGESLLAVSGMSDPATLDEAALRAVLGQLVDEEHEVSATRKQVQAILDTLSAEVTRRYRDGSATVDALLEG